MFVGTPLMRVYYRLMGAKVVKNCAIGTSSCVAFDPVDIGANTSIGTDTHVLGNRVEDGWLILRNVTVGSDSFVGTHCCLGLNVKMDDETRLDDFSLLADGTVMPKGEARRGFAGDTGGCRRAAIGYALYLRGPMTGVAVAFAAVPVALALHLAGSLLIRNATKLLRY